MRMKMIMIPVSMVKTKRKPVLYAILTTMNLLSIVRIVKNREDCNATGNRGRLMSYLMCSKGKNAI